MDLIVNLDNRTTNNRAQSISGFTAVRLHIIKDGKSVLVDVSVFDSMSSNRSPKVTMTAANESREVKRSVIAKPWRKKR